MIIEADKGFKLEHFEGKESLFPTAKQPKLRYLNVNWG